jgi:hypothetical protein
LIVSRRPRPREAAVVPSWSIRLCTGLRANLGVLRWFRMSADEPWSLEK